MKMIKNNRIKFIEINNLNVNSKEVIKQVAKLKISTLFILGQVVLYWVKKYYQKINNLFMCIQVCSQSIEVAQHILLNVIRFQNRL